MKTSFKMAGALAALCTLVLAGARNGKGLARETPIHSQNAPNDGAARGAGRQLDHADGDTWHPNEPDGFITLAESKFDSMTEGGFVAHKRNTLGSIVQDPSAPQSPDNVYRMVYTKGPHDGVGVENRLWSPTVPGGRTREMYVHTWWKVSDNWYGHSSGVNKMFFLTTVNNTGVVVEVGGKFHEPLTVRVVTQGRLKAANYYANRNRSKARIKRGKWQEWEVLVRAPQPGEANAELHVWLDRIKVIEALMPVNDVNAENRFQNLNVDPIWGGRHGSIPEEQYFYCDYIYVSYKRS